MEFVGDIFVIKKSESIVDSGWVHLWWGSCLTYMYNKKEREREWWIVEFVGDMYVIKKAESIVDGGWVHLWWGSCVTYI